MIHWDRLAKAFGFCTVWGISSYWTYHTLPTTNLVTLKVILSIVMGIFVAEGIKVIGRVITNMLIEGYNWITESDKL